MSGKTKIIVVLLAVAVAFFALLSYGLRSGRSDDSGQPKDEDSAAAWVEKSVPAWMKSFDKLLPKPRLEHPQFPLSLEKGRRRTLQIPPNDEHDYREAVFVHEQGSAVAVRYEPANPEEMSGDDDVLEFVLRAGPESRSRKSVVIGKSGGTLHLENKGESVARIGLAE
ncbi:MAG TPA: hypothetical protein VGA56_15735 [Opitutaceae bacterium]